jgi:hypothetical protein
MLNFIKVIIVKNLKRNLLLIFTLLLTKFCFTQHSFYAGGSFDIGVPMSNQFGATGARLSTHALSGHYAGNIGFQWRIMDRFSVELGIGQAYDTWRMRDNEFESRHDGFIVKLLNNHYSWNYFTNLAYYYPLQEDDLYLYGQLGYSFNQLSANTMNKIEEFEQVKNDVYESINMSTTYFARNRSIVPELGVQKKMGNHLISAGLKLNFGDAIIKSGKYDVLNLVDTTIVTNDSYSSKGNFLALSIKYNYLIHEIAKKDPKEKPEKEKKEKPEKEKKTKKERVKKEKKARKKKKEKGKKSERSRSTRYRYLPDDIFEEDYNPPSPY